MLINRQFQVICRGCHQEFTVYEYQGMDGSRYGSHFCKEMFTYMEAHPHWKRTFDYKKADVAKPGRTQQSVKL